MPVLTLTAGRIFKKVHTDDTIKNLEINILCLAWSFGAELTHYMIHIIQQLSYYWKNVIVLQLTLLISDHITSQFETW